MNKKTKLTAGMAATLLLSLTACGGGTTSNPNAFKMMAPTNRSVLGAGNKWGNKQFFQKMQELTGVEIDFSMVYDADTYGERKNKWYFDDESLHPDFFYKALYSRTDELELGSAGYLIPLEDYLEECCPNLCARMQENPYIEKCIRSADGHIYTLPTIHYAGENCNNADGYYFINKVWCAEVGVDPDDITTIEILNDTLQKFKTHFTSGGGYTYYPMYLSGIEELYQLFGSFGYSILSWNAYLDDNNKVHVPAAEGDARYKSMLNYFRKMYLTDGVINQYFDQETSTANKRYHLKRNEVGCFVDYSTEVAGDYAEDFVALPALTSSQYTGEAFWPGRIGVDAGAFAITAKCSDPKTILKWIDNVYDIEISRWDTIGVEGIDWKYDDEDKTTWSFIGDREEISANKCVQYGGGLPGVEMSYDHFYEKCSESDIAHSYSEIAKAQAHIKSGIPQVSIALGKLYSIKTVNSLVSEKVGNFILKSITDKNYNVDSEFVSLQSALDKAGIDDYVDVLQEACDEFYK